MKELLLGGLFIKRLNILLFNNYPFLADNLKNNNSLFNYQFNIANCELTVQYSFY